jgi:membrane-associated phospholipid phosphatase
VSAAIDSTTDRRPTASEGALAPWRVVAESLRRPYRVTVPMIAFVALIPAYVFIAGGLRERAVHAPALSWDRALPLLPSWALVYGALYLFLILLPVFVVRQEELLHRTVLSFLAIWITAYGFFLLYPTVAPRPEQVIGGGFGNWGLRILYDADPPYNCFPSLHVAHSLLSALDCYRVHRTLGAFAVGGASIVALSTLFTKQHYIADVIAGVLLALAAYRVFLWTFPRERVPAVDRRIAPTLGVGVAGVSVVSLLGFWLAYMLI